jgi:hypothetical protein
MFSPLRNRFGVPGVISVIALVFAMIGGAYAANDSGDGSKANASAKAKGKKGPRGPRGPAGPQGPAGPAGPAGPQGSAGPQGPAGANGQDGAAGQPGAPGAKGATGPSGPTGTKGATGAEGTEGSPWTAGGTLPSEATLTGTWAVGQSWAMDEGGESVLWAPLSFSIPLDPSALGLGTTVHVIQAAAPPTASCPGNVGDPQAAPGNLCVYAGKLVNAVLPGVTVAYGTNGDEVFNQVGTGGASVLVGVTGKGAEAKGSFAVTAP